MLWSMKLNIIHEYQKWRSQKAMALAAEKNQAAAAAMAARYTVTFVMSWKGKTEWILEIDHQPCRLLLTMMTTKTMKNH